MEFFFDEPVRPQQQANHLFLAASRGDADGVARYLESEDPLVMVNGMNSLHIACKKNRAAVVEMILKKDVTHVNDPSSDDKTALMIAAIEGNIDVIRVLRAAAENFIADFANVQNETGNSALHYCAWSGQEECCRYLVEECGADLMRKNKDGMMPIQFAAAANHAGLIDYLSSFGVEAVASVSASGLNNLHRACMHGSLDTVVTLVTKQCMNPNVAALGTGNTALHLAAKGGYNEIIRFLLTQPGIELNAQNKHGLTPLHFACNGGHQDTTELLLEANSDAAVRTSSGATALHLAAGSGNHELCELMTALPHADVSIEDDDGQTAIDMALSSGYKELASKLAYWATLASRSKSILDSTRNILAI